LLGALAIPAPVDFIENAVIPGIGRHPKNVVFLTADAFGVLPPISKLTPEQRCEALARREAGEAPAEIARSYNVGRMTITRLK